jgi:hypothetical protein
MLRFNAKTLRIEFQGLVKISLFLQLLSFPPVIQNAFPIGPTVNKKKY